MFRREGGVYSSRGVPDFHYHLRQRWLIGHGALRHVLSHRAFLLFGFLQQLHDVGLVRLQFLDLGRRQGERDTTKQTPTTTSTSTTTTSTTITLYRSEKKKSELVETHHQLPEHAPIRPPPTRTRRGNQRNSGLESDARVLVNDDVKGKRQNEYPPPPCPPMPPPPPPRVSPTRHERSRGVELFRCPSCAAPCVPTPERSRSKKQGGGGQQ